MTEETKNNGKAKNQMIQEMIAKSRTLDISDYDNITDLRWDGRMGYAKAQRLEKFLREFANSKNYGMKYWFSWCELYPKTRASFTFVVEFHKGNEITFKATKEMVTLEDWNAEFNN